MHFLAQWTEPGRVAANTVLLQLPPSGSGDGSGPSSGGGSGNGTPHPVTTCDKMRQFLDSLRAKVLAGTATQADISNLKSGETVYELQCLHKPPSHPPIHH